MRLFATACLGVLFCSTVVRADPADDIVLSEMSKQQIPGVAIGVVHKGKVVKLAGYGLADVEHKVPVTPQTMFQIQSITKTFMASAIMLLELDGKLKIEDPVGKHLEGTPEIWKDITIRHLLSHTSGIKDFINEPLASLRMEITDEKVFDEAAKRPLNFPVGTRYAYSNTNFHLLAMIVHKHTGQGYGEVLRKRIFEPAGMKSSRLMSWDDVIPNRARGYRTAALGMGIRNGEFVAQSVLAYGGGGILSNVDDMSQWDLALRNETILKKSTLEKMWTASKLNDGKATSYGLGWAVGGAPGHPTASHGGAHMTGFTTTHIRYLNDDLSVIVLANMRGANPGRIASKVAAVYVPELSVASLAPIEDKEPQVATRSREIVDELSSEKVAGDRYTAGMKEYLDRNTKQVAGLFPKSGSVQSMELLKRESIDKDALRYVYRLKSRDATRVVTIVYDQHQKVAGLWVSEE